MTYSKLIFISKDSVIWDILYSIFVTLETKRKEMTTSNRLQFEKLLQRLIAAQSYPPFWSVSYRQDCLITNKSDSRYHLCFYFSDNKIIYRLTLECTVANNQLWRSPQNVDFRLCMLSGISVGSEKTNYHTQLTPVIYKIYDLISDLTRVPIHLGEHERYIPPHKYIKPFRLDPILISTFGWNDITSQFIYVMNCMDFPMSLQ